MVWIQRAPGVFEGVPNIELDPETLRICIKLSNIPSITQATHRIATFIKRPGTEEALAAAKAFITKTPAHHFLAFSGLPGTGKTHLALAILWDWLERGRGTGAYWQVEALLDHLRGTFKKSQRDQEFDMETELGYIKDCGLLVLDDLGAEQATEWATAKLDEIVDHRYLNKKCTIFTTNVASDRLSPRILDRIVEGLFVNIKASSYRRLKK